MGVQRGLPVLPIFQKFEIGFLIAFHLFRGFENPPTDTGTLGLQFAVEFRGVLGHLIRQRVISFPFNPTNFFFSMGIPLRRRALTAPLGLTIPQALVISMLEFHPRFRTL